MNGGLAVNEDERCLIVDRGFCSWAARLDLLHFSFFSRVETSFTNLGKLNATQQNVSRHFEMLKVSSILLEYSNHSLSRKQHVRNGGYEWPVLFHDVIVETFLLCVFLNLVFSASHWRGKSFPRRLLLVGGFIDD